MWIGGYWNWVAGRHMWVGGHWEAPRPPGAAPGPPLQPLLAGYCGPCCHPRTRPTGSRSMAW
ncbi:hypothetical protein [Hydrogenophaga sp.]|uniref:hypothetical protein n=1 Tax=Hydrogenophaga sp. TaxID=1904254 RepID=UPI00261188D5|nr:hypothetical protein [Hydrogenophaga sp.]